MADSCQSNQVAPICLVGVMDRLWFQHAVIFPEQVSSVLCHKSPQLSSDSAPSPCSMDSSKPPLSEPQEIFYVLPEQGEAELVEKPEEEIIQGEEGNGNRPTRISQTSRKARSKSHSPKLERQTSKTANKKEDSMPTSKRLEKTISSKTYEDLEQEEVKGFIDLGFRFKKEHISPRMMTVVPGLQRIIKTSPKHVNRAELEAKVETYDNDKNVIGAMRPYLSEAWLIKRPDSPLLNMRVRRGYAAADMKKQLKCWARNVATETIQES